MAFGQKLRQESASAEQIVAKTEEDRGSSRELVLPSETITFRETVKEQILRRLSVSDSKFDIPSSRFVKTQNHQGTDADADADADEGREDVEDREGSKVVEKFLLNRVDETEKRKKKKTKKEKEKKKKKTGQVDNDDDDNKINNSTSRIFQLAQFYFEEKQFEKAFTYFDKIKDEDDQALFQVGVMLYDGLGVEADAAAGVEIMKRIAGNDPKSGAETTTTTTTTTSTRATTTITTTSMTTSNHLIPPARYNIGKAYFQGFGVLRQSEAAAEKWWLEAAADGDPKGSVKAQTMLGIFYARKDSLHLERSFFWHSEACGNGSLESQGAVGVMYLLGLGVDKNTECAFLSLTEASGRGSVYAAGNLVAFFYERQMFCNAADLGYKVSQLEFPKKIARRSGCIPAYVSKGIALACFYYGRCLDLGKGAKKDERLAQKLYSKSCRFSLDVAAVLQSKVIAGEI